MKFCVATLESLAVEATLASGQALHMLPQLQARRLQDVTALCVGLWRLEAVFPGSKIWEARGGQEEDGQQLCRQEEQDFWMWLDDLNTIPKMILISRPSAATWKMVVGSTRCEVLQVDGPDDLIFSLSCTPAQKQPTLSQPADQQWVQRVVGTRSLVFTDMASEPGYETWIRSVYTFPGGDAMRLEKTEWLAMGGRVARSGLVLHYSRVQEQLHQVSLGGASVSALTLGS